MDPMTLPLVLPALEVEASVPDRHAPSHGMERRSTQVRA